MGYEVVEKRGPGRPKKVITDEDKRRGVIVKDISKIVGNVLHSYKLPPCKTDDELIERINYYFQECQRQCFLPTIEGLALSLGVTRQALIDWEMGKYAPSRGPIIARAKELIAAIDAQLVSVGVLPAVPYIFRAKNYYGMSDKTEVQINSKDDRLFDEAELKQSIKDSIVIDDAEVLD